jgi:hypothetical protein
MKMQEQADEEPVVLFNETKNETCRHCGGVALWGEPFVDGMHPLCRVLRPLEHFLAATDDPSIEDETYRYRKTVHALLTLWEKLPRGEKLKTSHYLRCELADVNRMYAEVYLGDEDAADKDKQARAIAALREAGLEVVVGHVFEEDDSDGTPPTLCLDVHGVSEMRDSEFLRWLTDLLAPFGAHVHAAGYSDPPGPDAKRLTDH